MMPWLLLFTLALPDTITVDGSGGGDFTTIQEAIDAASPGDLIRVLPGVYPGFDLDKPLSILGLTGAPAPQIQNIVRVTGTGPVCVAGLALRTLQLNDIVGLAVVDDCTLGKWNRSILPAALQIRQCAAVVIGRCNILGQFGIDAGPIDGGPAVDVQEARVTITDSVMEGGWGTDDFENGGDGGAGVRATLGSWVELAGSSVKGGDEGAKICLCGSTGYLDDAVYASASTVVIRGSQRNYLTIGFAVFGIPPLNEGHAIHAVSSSTIVTSGVTVHAPEISKDATSTLLQLEVPEPYLEFGPAVQPGGTASLRVAGPAGAPLLLLVAPSAAPTPIGGFDGLLWPAVTRGYLLVGLTTQGQETPLELSATLPASPLLEGVTIWVQAVAPGIPSALVPGAALAVNPDVLVIR